MIPNYGPPELVLAVPALCWVFLNVLLQTPRAVEGVGTVYAGEDVLPSMALQHLPCTIEAAGEAHMGAPQVLLVSTGVCESCITVCAGSGVLGSQVLGQLVPGCEPLATLATHHLHGDGPRHPGGPLHLQLRDLRVVRGQVAHEVGLAAEVLPTMCTE